MRENLKRARKEKGLTQQQTADLLGIGLRHYKAIESGERLGSIEIWDRLEDTTKVNQRILREISETHHDKADLTKVVICGEVSPLSYFRYARMWMPR